MAASRAEISASTKVRSSSSGAQRWVLAARSVSGAISRTRRSFRRFRPRDQVRRERRRRSGHRAPRARSRRALAPERRERRSGSACPAKRARARRLPPPGSSATSAAVNRRNARARSIAPADRLGSQAAASPLIASISVVRRGVPAAAAARRKSSAAGPELEERSLGGGAGRTARTGRGARAAVVLVEHRDLAGSDKRMARDLATAGEDRDLASLDQDPHAAADQQGRDRVAGRAEPHRGQSIDLALDSGAELAGRSPGSGRSNSRSRSPAAPRARPAVSEWRRPLTSSHQVGAGLVRRRDVAKRPEANDEVALGVADEGLHHPLGLGILRLAEVGTEPVVSGEAHVVRVRHDEPCDRGRLQAPHPVRQHHRRHSARRLEALGQQAKGGGAPLVGGEAHEAEPAPRQHGAEDLQPVLGAPVDHQVLAGFGHPGAEHAAPPAPGDLGSATARRRLRAEPS